MITTTNKIKFKPYRGHLEPIREVRKSEIILHDNYLELIYDYNFTDTLHQEENRTAAYLLPKKAISIGLTVWYHEDDKEKIHYPRVEIYTNGSYCEYIYVETMDEADSIYKQIKSWLLK